MAVLLKIEVHDDATIRVTDDKNKEVPPAVPEAFARLSGAKIREAEKITVLISNPCTWVQVGSRWYWRCL